MADKQIEQPFSCRQHSHKEHVPKGKLPMLIDIVMNIRLSAERTTFTATLGGLIFKLAFVHSESGFTLVDVRQLSRL